MRSNCILTIMFLVLAVFSVQTVAGNNESADSIGQDKIKPFDKLIGTWNATQSIRNRDGSWTVQEKQYKWKFYSILEGEAVQDDWIVVDSTGRERATGTNIRIFNSEEHQWHMAWIDKTHRRLATFAAVYENGNIIMDGTNAQGRHIHNIFYNITEKSFEWKQEWTFDEGKSWVEVARIKCTKR